MPARFLRLVACLEFLVALVGSAAAATNLIDFRETQLDNGLRVISSEDRSAPIVAVQLWYHVGSKNEQPDRQGFAHMFEHMMFRGTDTLGPTDHFDYIRRTGGNCNAYTSFDQTVYINTLPSNQLELALWLEAQRMTFLKIDQESFDTERKVVEEERRLGMNRPYGTLMETLMAEIFKVHPYRWTPIGSIPDLRASSVAELRQFWTTYYVPNNATLVVVGDVGHDEVQRLAEKYFGWIPKYDAPPAVTVREPQQTAARKLELKDESAPIPLVGVFYRTVPESSPDQTPLEMMASILGGDASSRLYRELVVKQQRAMMTMNLSQSLEQDGMYAAVTFLTPTGGKFEPVIETVKSEMERARREPVTDRELAKARNQRLKAIVSQSETIEGKARLLGQAAVIEGDAARVNRKLDEIRQVGASDLQRVADTYFAPERSTLLTIESSGGDPFSGGAGAKKGAEEEAAPITATPETDPPPPGRGDLKRPADFPARAPLAGRAAFNVVPEHHRETLPNGLTLLVIPNHEVPIVNVNLGVKYGAASEDKPGTVNLAASMLTEGTKKRSEAELADELGAYAIDLAGSATLDSVIVSLGCLTEHLDRGVDLMAEVTLEPTFPKEEFERVREQTRGGLQMQAASPEYIAQRELRKRLFGEHPYARSATGEAEDLDALTPEDLKAWWSRFVRPDQAVLVFAGDIEVDRARQLAERALGGWTAEGAKPEVAFPEPPRPGPTHIYLVDRRGTQSEIVAGSLGVNYKHPGYFTSQFVSQYFGGAFSSRLNDTIRVKLGLTYGANGGFRPQTDRGTFAVRTFSKTGTTAEALGALFDELRRLVAEPPSDDEVASTQSFLLGSFPLERETPEAIAADLWLLERQGLPTDFLQEQYDTFAALTSAECIDFAKASVDPAKMTVVVVGPAKELKEPLEKIAPVTVVERKRRR